VFGLSARKATLPLTDPKPAVFRLLTMVMAEDGFDSQTTDDVVRSVWESDQESTVSKPGKKRAKPLLEGKHCTDMRRQRSYPNPFEQRVV
jgi:hypothetical protein